MLKPYEQRFPWMLDWNLLRTFMMVVEQRSITKAADALGLKQPTVSSALARLEDTTGHKLINRKPNHFSVTPAGQILYDECGAIFGAVSQLPALMGGIGDQITGHVSIVMASHVVSDHLDRVLEDFARAHPHVTFSLSIAESSEVVSHVRHNRVTLGICLAQPNDARVRSRVLFREKFGLYCGPRHRLFGNKKIAPAELAGEPSVGFQTETEGGPLEAVARLRARVRMNPERRGVSANLPEIRRMIMANIGIGALPVHVADKDVKLGSLWQLPPYSRLPSVDICLLSNPRRSLTPPETRLLALFDRMLDDIPLQDRTYPAPKA